MQKSSKHQKSGNIRRLSDSQNFLTDRRLIHRIVGLARIHSGDTVLEIGTGKGHLTEELCRRAGNVYSIEIDRKLYESAGKRLAKYDNVNLVCADFLKYNLPVKGAYKVYANIPFFITTQIIDRLTRSVNPPTDMWLVMEKGAAKRFAGTPKETEKSLLLKVNWEMKTVYRFHREDFHPMPSTDVVLVHFHAKETSDLNGNQYRAFEKFIRHSMGYGICGRNGLLTKRQMTVAFKQAGMPHAHEDGVTLYIQWLCLFRWYWENCTHT